MTDRTAEHARLAPSGAHRWGPDGCAGSVAMEDRQPEQEPTEESREGDAAHWLLAQTLLKLTVPAGAIAPNGVAINDEMRDAIVEMVDDVNDTLKGCRSGDYYEIEQRIAASELIHSDCWGTPDVLFVQHSRKTVHIWDFKYGHRFVDAYRNWQMIAYAACAIEDAKIGDAFNWSFTFTIAQPRCFERDELGGTLREWFVSGKDLLPLHLDLRRAAAEALHPDAQLRTGKHCRDCRAQWDCPANQRAGGAALDVIRTQGSAGMDARAIGLEAKVLAEAMDFVKARLSALDEQALALLGRGEAVPFHSLGWTQPRLAWDKDRQAEAAGIVAMFGVDVQPGVALPTPSQCIKQGVDGSVITPYTRRNEPSRKLLRVDDTSASKILGRR
jgi:hypothetical protein